MQKKIGDIIQAFQNYRFEDALRQIDQLIKKVGKDTKKKNVLTNKDQRIVNIVKVGSLASTGKLHEANQIFNTYFTDKIISQIPADQAFLFISIAQLAYDNNLLKHIQQFVKQGKNDNRLQRFMLSRRMFSTVSKSFLKQFVVSKKSEDGLAQIYLEYLNQINKNKSIQQRYKKDLKIFPQKQLNLKMVQLFFMKYLMTINIAQLKSAKLRSSIIDLKLRLMIHGNKHQQAKKTYLQYFDYIQEHFVYLRSIRGFPQNAQENHNFYIENCGKIFKRNLQVQKYVPLYDFYNEFLDFILSITDKTKFELIINNISQKKPQSKKDIYNFEGITTENVLIHYYHSLQTELYQLTKGQTHQKAKKSDYYKISIKGLLLQLLKIIYLINKTNNNLERLYKNTIFSQYLNTYFMQFSKTLTYINEMKQYLPFLKQKFADITQNYSKLPEIFTRKDDNLILLINKIKIQTVLSIKEFDNLQAVQKWSNICWSYYKKYIFQIQQSKKRQKGQVFLSDQFITTLADIIIFYIENNLSSQEASQTIIISLLSKLMSILDYSTELSPYNAYLKLRLIYVCQKLNYFDKLIDTYISMDIKSVQFQTLGYFLINPLMNFNLYNQYENNLTKMVRSYYQNQRQTSEYCLKGLKAGTVQQVYQYFSYQKRLQKSISKMMLFFVLFIKHQNQPQSQFYLNWIQNGLNQEKQKKNKIIFNCDTKTMNNLISTLDLSEKYSQNYNQFYGYYNSISVFEFIIKLKQFQFLLKRSILKKSQECQKQVQNKFTILIENYNNLLKADINCLFNLQQQYNFLDDYLRNQKSLKNKQKFNYTQKTIIKDYQFFLKLLSIRIQSITSINLMKSLAKQSQKNQKLQMDIQAHNKQILKKIQQLNIIFSSQLTWQQQIKNCWSFRQTLLSICHLFNELNSQINKDKKVIKPSKSLISTFYKNVYDLILLNMTSIKFKQNNINLNLNNVLSTLDIEKQYINKILQRNQILKRFVNMDIKQAKQYLPK